MLAPAGHRQTRRLLPRATHRISDDGHYRRTGMPAAAIASLTSGMR
jgi:hypothetical protein